MIDIRWSVTKEPRKTTPHFTVPTEKSQCLTTRIVSYSMSIYGFYCEHNCRQIKRLVIIFMANLTKLSDTPVRFIRHISEFEYFVVVEVIFRDSYPCLYHFFFHNVFTIRMYISQWQCVGLLRDVYGVLQKCIRYQ